MMVMERAIDNKVDYLKHRESEQEPSVAHTILALSQVAMRFAHVERAPRYDDGRRENDAEHSFMLSLVAVELAAQLYAHMDKGLVAQFATVHDLPELVTKDVPTFNITTEALHQKEADERRALPTLLAQLPPHTRRMVTRYEQQDTIEARFVRAVDKQLPVAVDLWGDGQRVMREDYGIVSLEQLQSCNHTVHQRIIDRFGEFPELIFADLLLRELFEAEFIAE